tara:strand:- start:259 stop:783 length:525 start_codon:yes stop_codon:yes gene_type:complete
MNQIVSHENNAEKNYELLTPIVEKLKSINITILKGRLQRGMLLQKVKEQKLFLGYDGWVNTWAEFLDNINISRETARQDIEIYNEFFDYLENEPLLLNTISYERLVRLLPVVKKDKSSLSKLLDMAARSNRTDFDNNIKEAKGLVPTDKCNCENLIILARCTICGVTYRRKDLE